MKIQNIRTKLNSQDPEPSTIPMVSVKEEDMFLSFQPLTEDDVRKLIKQSNMALEGMPRFSASRINTFSKQIPSNWILPWRVETALVKPLLKKLGLQLVFQSFRPVSNCHLSLNLLKRHQLTIWVTIWTKCGLYHRVNQPIDHSTVQKQHFWRYSLIFYWTWMIRKSPSLSCLIDWSQRSIRHNWPQNLIGNLRLRFWWWWNSFEMVHVISFSKNSASTN